MIYADEMAYDEQEPDTPLAVSIQLSGDEETKQSLTYTSNRASELDDLKSSYWMPVSHDNFTKSQLDEMVRRNEIKKLDLPQISQKNLLHRKANLDDFKASIDKPTVLPPFIELYVKF